MNLLIDCTNGISSDMVLTALIQLGANEEKIGEQIQGLSLADLSSHRSYQGIKNRLTLAPLAEGVGEKALRIYEAIAKAEAKVHGETLETVHFHEVGRDKAIAQIVGVATAIEDLGVEEIYCSALHDGTGSIECSHGVIPVPVPAVCAMKEQCDYDFGTDEIEMEMVTPSGLAVLIGLGAKKANHLEIPKDAKVGIGKGTRDTGRDGLKITAW
ncbi:MAG: nickel insertion protein [Anaerovoracaceae bacterium]